MATRSAVKLFGVVCVAAMLVLAHEGKPWPVPQEERDRKNPVPAGEASLKEGKALYTANCAVCHGEKGDGNGPGAKALKVKPEAFTDAEMMNKMTDGELFYKMSEGRMPMPGFKAKLSEEQRWQVIHYIRTFGKKGAAKGAKKPEAHKH